MNASFCLEKSIHAILYVANKLDRKDFHKIFKVLYFADINHYGIFALRKIGIVEK